MSELNFYAKVSDHIMITKSNTLVEAGYDLTFAEQDLMTLAVNKLHKLNANGKQVMISAKEFANANNVTDNYAYQTLKEVAKTLGDKKLKFTLYRDLTVISDREEDKLTVIKPTHSHYTVLRAEYNWLQGISYQDQMGFIIIHFSDPLAFLIENTSKAYTKYNYAKTLKFSGCSSKRLYELIHKWKGMKKIPAMTVFEWKELFGVADKYPKVAEFRRRVLDPAIEQINAQGEFVLKLEPIKAGRFISHFVIHIQSSKQNADKSPNLANSSSKLLSQAQADKFAKLLANDSSFGSKFARAGESMSEFLVRLSQDLQRDSQKVSDYMPYLTRLGFK